MIFLLTYQQDYIIIYTLQKVKGEKMAIKILIDSASDITLEEAKEYGIELMSMYINIDGKEYLDAVDIKGTEFYEKLAKCNEIPKTSLITPNRFFDKFNEMTANGDQVIAITMSSKLSGTYNSACLAAEDFEGQVYVVDSMSVAGGERILCEYALNVLKENLTIKEIVDKLNKEKVKINVFTIIDTLKYLKKGGRLSTIAAIAGEILFVKPIMTVYDGVIKELGKAIGSRKAFNLLNKLIGNRGGVDYNKPYCLMWSGTDDSAVKKYINESKDFLKELANNIKSHLVGSTIGTHVGPGVVGFAFFEK